MTQRLSLSTRVLIALAAGIALGLAASASRSPLALRSVSIVAPVGTLFINAIRMTVIPLVVSLVVVGVATADAKSIAKLGGRALAAAVILLSAAALAGALIAPPVFARLTIDPAAAVALRDSTHAATGADLAGSAPTLGRWLMDVVPANPVQSAATGAMLPLVVFAVTLGLALLALAPAQRDPVVRVFRGIGDAMLVLVRWILVLAPIGVFALTYPLLARLGLAALGALATYVLLVVVCTIVFILLIVYPAAAMFGGVSLANFARAVLPAQAVAFSARSSLAALPALIEGAQRRLGMSAEASGFLLPVASSLFRVGGALGVMVGAAFVARLYGADLGAAQLLTAALTAVLISFSIPGIPAGSIVAMVPVLASVGLPIEGIGVLLGVDAIPDAFRTTANVTGQMAAATIAEPRGR